MRPDAVCWSGSFVPLQSDLLSDLPRIRHGVTKRVAGAGTGDANIGYGSPRNRDAAWSSRQRWAATMGIDAEVIVTCSQVHGASALRVDAGDAGHGARPDSASAGPADALMTNSPGVALLTLHADCAPILLVDPVGPVIAAVHAGWRGTVADIAGATVKQMHEQLGSDPRRIKAFIGPAIGPCCYVVGSEVLAAWHKHTDLDTLAAVTGDRYFDLPLANQLQLSRAGLDVRNIEQVDVCTRCEEREWFSHRAQGPLTGRFGALIAIEASPACDGI